MATEESILAWLWETLEGLGGKAEKSEIARAISQAHGAELRDSGMTQVELEIAIEHAAETLENQEKLRRDGDTLSLHPAKGQL